MGEVQPKSRTLMRRSIVGRPVALLPLGPLTMSRGAGKSPGSNSRLHNRHQVGSMQ